MALGYRASYLSCSSYTGCLASKNLVNAFPSSNSLARVFRSRSAREITIPFRLPFSIVFYVVRNAVQRLFRLVSRRIVG